MNTHDKVTFTIGARNCWYHLINKTWRATLSRAGRNYWTHRTMREVD